MTPLVFLLRIDDARNMRRLYRPPVPRARKNKFGISRHKRPLCQRYSDLQERWYGRPGEEGEYAASLLQSPGGDEGKIAHVPVAESVLDFENNSSKLLGFSGVSYARMIESFGAPERVLGLANHDWNMLMFCACAADRNGVRFTAKKIGDRWEKDLWGAKDYYDSGSAGRRDGCESARKKTNTVSAPYSADIGQPKPNSDFMNFFVASAFFDAARYSLTT